METVPVLSIRAVKWARAALVASLVALVIAVACEPVPGRSEATVPPGSSTPGSSLGSVESAPPESIWGPLAVVPPQDGSDSARYEGTLDITETCVFLDAAGGPVLLLWPADRTAWVEQRQMVEFTNPDGSTVAVEDGAFVVVGGSGDDDEELGTTTEEWLARTPWVQAPSEMCPLKDRWWVGSLDSGS